MGKAQEGKQMRRGGLNRNDLIFDWIFYTSMVGLGYLIVQSVFMLWVISPRSRRYTTSTTFRKRKHQSELDLLGLHGK